MKRREGLRPLTQINITMGPNASINPHFSCEGPRVHCTATCMGMHACDIGALVGYVNSAITTSSPRRERVSLRPYPMNSQRASSEPPSGKPRSSGGRNELSSSDRESQTVGNVNAPVKKRPIALVFSCFLLAIWLLALAYLAFFRR